MSVASMSNAEPEVVLDLSRLLSRILHRTPTGVDRVEMAYARGLLAAIPERLAFGAVHPSGRYGRIPRWRVSCFLDDVQSLWATDDRPQSAVARYRRALGTLWSMRPRPVPQGLRPRIVLQASPHHLTNLALVRNILDRERAHFVCLLHDLIPITHPEYARPGGAALHLRRMATLAETADAVIANSRSTLDAFTRHRRGEGRDILSLIAHLGIDGDETVTPASVGDGRPYFVCVGTIEPRKNHLLLLHLWREMAERLGPQAVPRLLVIGRRGWENEQIVDMLERCSALTGCVEERSDLRDREMRAIISGACAVLLPSFAEGFGMPVPEALAAGVPVICSDLASLREAGGNVPDYLDPLDGLAWRERILAFAQPGSPLRAAQIARIEKWTPTTWNDHLAKVLDLLHRLPA